MQLPVLLSLAESKAKEHGWVSLHSVPARPHLLIAAAHSVPILGTDLLVGALELGCGCSPGQGKVKPRVFLCLAVSCTQGYLLYLSWSGGGWKCRTQGIQMGEIQTQQYLAVVSSNPWRSQDQNAWIPLVVPEEQWPYCRHCPKCCGGICPVPSPSGAAGVGALVLLCSPDHSEKKGLDPILPCILSQGSGF